MQNDRNDLISREEAIVALGKDPGFKVRLFGKSYDEGRSDQWFRDVHKLTTLPSAQPEPHWIPCSERLPEHTGAYLVTTIVAVDKYVITSWYSTKGGWICEDRPEAWMPLPEPYKEEEQNG